MADNASRNFRKFVLIVDDEEVNRKILGHILEQEYEVMYASNGQEALDTLHCFSDILSLVLLDILMPVKDGYQVLEEMHEHAALAAIPVVVLTSEKEAEVKSLRLGAADFLTKPYDTPEVILARAKHSIDLYENTSLIHATETDPLTGLYTKEFFFEYCEQYMKHHQDTQLDAVVMNINRFHLINALYGRHFGDKILCAVSNRLRHSEMVLEGLACRYDADSFYLFIPHTDDYDSLYHSIVIGITELIKDGDMRLRMGVYSNISRENDLEENFSWALQACNSVRSEAGYGVALFDDLMHDEIIRRGTLLDGFESALDEDQFELLYQPVFDIKGEIPRMTGAKAFVRWNHPELGEIMPEEFIPLLEENGLICRFDRYVWEKAVRHIREWIRETGVTLSVGVNVSRVDLYDSDITDFISDLVLENDIPEGVFHLEMTGSAYSVHMDHVTEGMNRLRALGFKTSMGDFGTAFSSLNMLNKLPVDVLKIDGSFLQNISSDDRTRRLVSLVIDAAHSLDMTVEAVGVCSESEYEILRSQGCDLIQGFFRSEFFSVSDMTALLLEKKDEIG